MRVLAWPRDQKSRGEWDETQNLDGMFAAGTAADRLRRAEQGAGESAGCEAVGTGEEAAEPPDETPESEPAKPEEKEPLSLEDVLTDIYTVAPGTAGRALCGPPMPPENCWTGSM